MALGIGLPRSSALQNDGLDAPVILQCRTPQKTNPKGHWVPHFFFIKSLFLLPPCTQSWYTHGESEDTHHHHIYRDQDKYNNYSGRFYIYLGLSIYGGGACLHSLHYPVYPVLVYPVRSLEVGHLRMRPAEWAERHQGRWRRFGQLVKLELCGLPMHSLSPGAQQH